jgi:hypothetical protein
MLRFLSALVLGLVMAAPAHAQLRQVELTIHGMD